MSMSIPDYTALTRETSRNLAPLRAKLPDVMQGFGALSKAALAPGALDAKTKELIAIAIGIALRKGQPELQALLGKVVEGWHRSGLIIELEKKYGIEANPWVAEQHARYAQGSAGQ